MSSSRDKILASIKQNQPEIVPLPELAFFQVEADLIERFTEVAVGIGSKVFPVPDLDHVKKIISQHFDSQARIVSPLDSFSDIAQHLSWSELDPHDLHHVDLGILNGHFAVAENSAIWVTEEQMGQRVLPFINQHLALIVNKKDILPTLHQAYERIGESCYGFGTFIAGPSKTADIEQSLVLGAHGPRSLFVFLVD